MVPICPTFDGKRCGPAGDDMNLGSVAQPPVDSATTTVTRSDAVTH
jgi:hypothetical protein